jgi:hypothetical protein
MTSTAAETRVEESSTKRKSGRAKGPKAKKARLNGDNNVYHTFRSDPPSIEVPTTHYPEVNEHNKKYYEFQWRVLNLCSEFYAAADGLLVRAATSSVAYPRTNISAGDRKIHPHSSLPSRMP